MGEQFYNDPKIKSSRIMLPVLPFPLAANLVLLYFTHQPGECSFYILPICLAIGGMSIFISIIGLASKCIIDDAWKDGRITKSEHSVLWLYVNKNKILVMSQVVLFVGFFLYLLICRAVGLHYDPNQGPPA